MFDLAANDGCADIIGNSHANGTNPVYYANSGGLDGADAPRRYRYWMSKTRDKC